MLQRTAAIVAIALASTLSAETVEARGHGGHTGGGNHARNHLGSTRHVGHGGEHHATGSHYGEGHAGTGHHGGQHLPTSFGVQRGHDGKIQQSAAAKGAIKRSPSVAVDRPA